MDIVLRNITVRNLTDGFVDYGEEGIFGYGGKLNIRPKYQREFVYKDKQRNAVIDTILRDYPLNSIYWSENSDGTLEVLDGQQRIISICQYVNDEFSVSSNNLDVLPHYFTTLPEDTKRAILNYKLKVYFCHGDEQEKLDWFRIVNIAGVELTEQELRNAVYSGDWVTSAKTYFSKVGCAASKEADGYLAGSVIRQDYLETAIDWISNGKIEDYMSKHRHELDAKKLWTHFKKIINWVKSTFPEYRREMKNVDWGTLYRKFHKEQLNSSELEKRIADLLADDEVQRKSGIWPYVLTGLEKHLNLRTFTDSQKRTVYEKQKGKCKKCKKKFNIEDMEADHIDPWHEGGETIPENCQVLCKPCNRRKSGK